MTIVIYLQFLCYYIGKNFTAMRKIYLFSRFVLLLFPLTTLFAQVKINGRIQYDFEFLKREQDSAWTMGNEFRRVHLSAAGKLASNLKYKIEVNFSHAKLGFRDVYIQYDAREWGSFAVGSKAEPTGLAMLTSSKYIPFVERPMLTALQDFRWGTGLHYANHKLLDGRLGFQASLTNKGKHSEGFVDKHLEDGMNFTTRLYGVPYLDKENKTLVHTGVNYSTRTPADLKFRPENHLGSKYAYVFPGAARRLIAGGELAAVYKSFSLQTEYKMMQVPNMFDKDYAVPSFYVMGSFFLTGEYRPYKKGAFGRVKPKKPVGEEGFGALELLVRYSAMQFSDDLVQANIGNPSDISNVAIGLNWYLNAHARIMYNYVLTDDKSQNNLMAHLIRFQIDF